MEEFLSKHAEYVVLAVLVIEWALGNTKLVKANSTVEAVLNVVSDLLRAIKPKDK
jgi:hypothetical protein